jgi:acyl carrier protein
MSLIATLEEAFGVSLSEAEVLGIGSYASAAEVLRSKNLASS